MTALEPGHVRVRVLPYCHVKIDDRWHGEGKLLTVTAKAAEALIARGHVKAEED